MYPYPYEDPRRERKLQYYAALGKELKKKERAKEAEAKKAAQHSLRIMTSLEWFILGIVMHPVVGILWEAGITHLKTMVH